MKFVNKRNLKYRAKRILIAVLSFCMVVTILPLGIKVNAAETAEATSLFTDYQPTINEIIDASGFKHPGVGLTKDILENMRTEVLAQKDPWYSYYNAMLTSSAASKTVTSSNQSSADPTKIGSDAFDSQGFDSKFIADGLKAYTQALMYYITGDEVYRINAMHIIRIWSQMDPTKYVYFTDACIHTGVPLNRMTTAAEILRYTSCETEELKWTDKDTVDFTTNLVNPVIETFQHDQNHFMNQHNYPLLGAMAGYIFTGNIDRYNESVEWFTVNSTATDQGFNGSVKQLFRWVTEEEKPGMKVGEGTPVEPHVQHMEMGRDQAHGGGDLQNAAMICRLILAQGTKVDPVKGIVSTAADAVGPYEFLNDRLLAAGNYFWQFMQGYDTQWTPQAYAISPDGNIRDTYNYISNSYRGRYATANFWDFYSYYTYIKAEDVSKIAPYYYEAFTKKLVPNADLWNSPDACNDYWLYLPKAAEADASKWISQVKSSGNFIEVEDRYTKLTKLDNGKDTTKDNIDTTTTTTMTEGDTTFVRFNATEAGSKIAVLSFGSGTKTFGFKIRTNGPATLDAVGCTLTLPNTNGEWKYFTASGALDDYASITVKGTPGTTVDLDKIDTAAGTDLTAPVFKSGSSGLKIYTYVGASVNVDFSATDTNSSDVITYGLQNNPVGLSINTSTGAFSWQPTVGENLSFLVTASDGTTITTKNVNIIVGSDRASAVQAITASYNASKVYVEASLKNFQTVYSDTMSQINTASDEAFDKQSQALRSATESLALVTPLAQDGTMRWSSVAASSSWGSAAPNLDDCSNKSGGWYGLALGSAPNLYHIIDFGPDYKISANKFGFQSNIFADRLANSTVYGSNDGETWTRLTPGVTQLTQDYQTLDVDSAYQNNKYRFIKLEMIKPLPDVLYGMVRNFLELQEFRIYGTRYEICNKLQSVSLGSDNSVNSKISTGNVAKITIKAKESIKNVKVKIQGVDATVSTQDNINWTAVATMNGDVQTGQVKFTIDYQRSDGTNGDTTCLTTDSSKLLLVDGSKFINVPKLATVTASDKQWPGTGMTKEQVGYLLFDGNTATAGDLNTASGSYYTVDFGEDASVNLNEILLMPRPSNTGRVNGLIVQGSNDNLEWTNLTKALTGAKDNTWSDIRSDAILDHNNYRYLRLYNSTAWSGNVAEVEFYGQYNFTDIDSKVVAPAGYTEGSYYLYQKEVERIKAAISQPEADRMALLTELYKAEGQLVLTSTIIAPKIAVTQSMVVASGKSWGTGNWNGISPEANGWLAFDGDTTTYLDANNPAWVKVDLGAGKEQVLGSVKFYPRSGNADRVNGSIQGSNDGTTFVTLYTISGFTKSSLNQWYTGVISDNTAYRYIRYYNTTGFADVCELEYYSKVNDKTLLTVLLGKSAAIDKVIYTPASVATLQLEVTAAQLVADKASATQAEIDAAATKLQASYEGLKLLANKTVLTNAISTATTLLESKTVGIEVENVPKVAKTAFQSLIDAATAVNTNAEATQAEVDAQVVAIATATTNFNDAVIKTTPVATVAVGITSVVATIKDATRLTLPTVPEGYTIAIKSTTSTVSTIAINGTIATPKVDTIVAVVFTITRISNNSTADTASINVVIPAKTKSAETLGIPGKPVLADNNGQANGLKGGTYNITMNLWWGINGNQYKLYEDGILIDAKSLIPSSPKAQTAVTLISGKQNGTHKYYCELINDNGTATSNIITVNVTNALPGKIVISNDNWDGDGNYKVNANMWWGTNGKVYKLYENGVLIDKQTLIEKTPQAQATVTNISGRKIGIYNYYCEFINEAGVTTSNTITVKVIK